ncbi:alpha/beta fold hydrolase [Parapedobacter koreensis]|uniref:Pimeloyl-ACP methyl ester carboxylesterase n=1 Tax=Parapedobacter koreensis TaxID=332977 RepID=A0A1H7NL59_9SPHI|nr:alpha/beta hydrolase [Parapedobacter koreensis]SEL24292.1 Pimeloyl-ACP methyl ester carboxylesterase [Parapedobacter koreensis]
MNPKFITIANIKLAYYTKNDDADQTIFFVHGNSANAQTWKKQFDDPRLNTYRLVALDLPAHGHSSPSPHPATDYNAIGLGKYVDRFIQKLANGYPYLIVSISLGTNFVAEALIDGLRPKGLIFLGPCLIGPEVPVSDILQPDSHAHVIFTDTPDENDLRQYIREMHYTERPEDLETYLQSYNQVIAPFRSIIGQSVAEQRYNDEIGFVNAVGIPILICMGKEERVVNTNYLDGKISRLWRNEIILLPDAGHLINVDQPDLLNARIVEFSAEVFDI